MNENSNSPSVKKKPSVTVKNVLRTLTFCCAILFFCPMFMVSCSDSDWGVDTDLMKVSAITAIKGISGMGETLVQPHPILVLCLLLPVAAIILLFIKKFTDKQIATSVCGATAVDLIIWIIFRTTAKKLAEDSQCQFEMVCAQHYRDAFDTGAHGGRSDKSTAATYRSDDCFFEKRY